MAGDIITIVSGLPRSGTSMMMRMLEEGGMPVLTDEFREADEDNPRGYYEYERVKQIQHDQAWLKTAQGKVVKLISAHLRHLPAEYVYRVIFMQRDMQEILASQRQMLVHRGEPADEVSDGRMAALFSKHLEVVDKWLALQPNIRVLRVDYAGVLADPPREALRVNTFLGGILDEELMAAAVEGSLYRQRRP